MRRQTHIHTDTQTHSLSRGILPSLLYAFREPSFLLEILYNLMIMNVELYSGNGEKNLHFPHEALILFMDV